MTVMTDLRDGPAAQAAGQWAASSEGLAALAAFDGAFIFDMDDTLHSNRAVFEVGKTALGEFLAEIDRDARDPQSLLARHHEIDLTLIATLGYTPQRWRTSCLQVATEIHGPLTADLHDRCLQVADIALGVGEMFPGVRETLQALKHAGVTTVLCTKGDDTKQREKIEAHGLADLVTAWRIVPRKDTTTFADLAVEHRLPGRVVSIGDSLASDIHPALHAGLDAIHITGNTCWETGDTTDDHVTSAPSMPEAVKLAVLPGR